jgi:hypothetical protein
MRLAVRLPRRRTLCWAPFPIQTTPDAIRLRLALSTWCAWSDSRECQSLPMLSASHVRSVARMESHQHSRDALHRPAQRFSSASHSRNAQSHSSKTHLNQDGLVEMPVANSGHPVADPISWGNWVSQGCKAASLTERDILDATVVSRHFGLLPKTPDQLQIERVDLSLLQPMRDQPPQIPSM